MVGDRPARGGLCTSGTHHQPHPGTRGHDRAWGHRCAGGHSGAGRHPGASRNELTAEPKTLTFAYAQTITCLDPAFQTGTPNSNLTDNLFNGLVTHKPGTLTEVAPDLAESWEVSDDGLVYTFNLRPGVQWQSGYGELAAADVVYSWERILNPDTAARGGTLLAPVESIEAVDDLTVQVTLKAPNAPFLVNIRSLPHQ